VVKVGSPDVISTSTSTKNASIPITALLKTFASTPPPLRYYKKIIEYLNFSHFTVLREFMNKPSNKYVTAFKNKCTKFNILNRDNKNLGCDSRLRLILFISYLCFRRLTKTLFLFN
jgi:hypothetical protein